MIIGHGLLGSAFLKSVEHYKDYIVFTSGVSNSKEIKTDDFKREKNLVLKTIRDHRQLTFIYFSSVLAGINNNKYYNHKLEIEALIKKETEDYIIFRIPQIIGRLGNKNNLINHFKNSIKANKEIVIYTNAQRALIDIDDLANIVDYCKDVTHDKMIYLSGIEKIDVSELVDKIGGALNKKPIVRFEECDGNNWYQENSPVIEQAIKYLGIEKLGYTEKIIRKYVAL